MIMIGMLQLLDVVGVVAARRLSSFKHLGVQVPAGRQDILIGALRHEKCTGCGLILDSSWCCCKSDAYSA